MSDSVATLGDCDCVADGPWEIFIASSHPWRTERSGARVSGTRREAGQASRCSSTRVTQSHVDSNSRIGRVLSVIGIVRQQRLICQHFDHSANAANHSGHHFAVNFVDGIKRSVIVGITKKSSVCDHDPRTMFSPERPLI